MKASLTLAKSEQKYDIGLCQGRTAGRTTIKIRLGVVGHWGENNFQFLVRIDGQKPLVIESEDGFFKKDISYCSDRATVNVRVTAVEKDLLFDDQYNSVLGKDVAICCRG